MADHGLRILFYSHDTVGIGHTRRNLLIARALRTALSPVSILLITGSRISTAYATPPGIDFLTLPSLGKDPSGGYRTRSLGIDLDQLVRVRTSAIRGAMDAFDPDVVIVDKVPRGALRELDPALEQLRRRGRARFILGLRDILDEPGAVRRDWQRDDGESAIRDLYDAVWIYGDPDLYALIQECELPEAVGRKALYTGYLNPLQVSDADDGRGTKLPVLEDLGLPPGRLALCQVGGGEDGARLAEAFVQASLPADMNGLLLTGPYMPESTRRRLEDRASGLPRLRILPFVSEPTALLPHADRVISMGGYNTVCELLAYGKASLIVPRTHPRREQLIRARRLQERGLMDCIPPERLSPRALSGWLSETPSAPRRRSAPVDMDGLRRVSGYLERLLETDNRVQACA